MGKRFPDIGGRSGRLGNDFLNLGNHFQSLGNRSKSLGSFWQTEGGGYKSLGKRGHGLAGALVNLVSRHLTVSSRSKMRQAQ
jgi:hypothetical protein